MANYILCRLQHAAQLLRDYRDMGVEEIIFIDPEERSIVTNGVPPTGGRFTLASVSFQVSDLW